jgi:tRNA-dihydrouridine synthase
MGHDLAHLHLHPQALAQLACMLPAPAPARPRQAPPVSVKTRIGYDTVVAEHWVACLLEEHPDVITIHGRTLAQMYRGQADWEAIRRAAKLGRQTATLILGNGDVQTMAEAVQRVRATQVHGLLIGRGAMGNPWLFRTNAWGRSQYAMSTDVAEPSPATTDERFRVALEHARYFEALHDGCPFVAMRKHLGWYCRGFPGAATARAALFQTTNAAEVATVLAHYGLPKTSEPVASLTGCAHHASP